MTNPGPVWIARRDATGAGPTLAVKDNIDVEGFDTTAGCSAYAYRPTASAPVVARLVAAGYDVVGKTALDQFATGLVGTRSPWGALESPIAPGRVSGGSSSGSAVAVATGAADVALGTDTAGSGRVPAAFCGIVGLKPTRGWLSTQGVVPACPTLDCVSVFARDVATAAAAVEVAGGPMPGRPGEPVRRVGVPSLEVLERWCDGSVVEAFARIRSDLPFEVHEVDIRAYLEAGELLYGGAFVAERYASVGAFVDAHHDDCDPTVAAIISAGAVVPAAAYVADTQRRAVLARGAARVWEVVDAVLLPTAPHHPTLDEVAADPIGANAALGRFTNGCNLVDWCAAAIPAGPGVSLFGPAWSDRSIWAAAAALLEESGRIPIAVAGAHLQGQPLNWQLTSRGGRLLRATTTAAAYRMVRLPTEPPKPGLERVPSGGAAIEVEVWDLPAAGFGPFVAAIPAPLGIGQVELADGSSVPGFLCEAWAAEGAEDITTHGGWRAWLGAAP